MSESETVDWEAMMPEWDSEDCLVAIQAAQSMADRFREHVAIQEDLSVVLLRDADKPALEIILYRGVR